MSIRRIRWTTSFPDDIIFNSRIDVVYRYIHMLMHTYENDNIYMRIEVSKRLHKSIFSLYRESRKCKANCNTRITDIINTLESSLVIFKGTVIEDLETRGHEILRDDIEILRLCLRKNERYYRNGVMGPRVQDSWFAPTRFR